MDMPLLWNNKNNSTFGWWAYLVEPQKSCHRHWGQHTKLKSWSSVPTTEWEGSWCTGRESTGRSHGVEEGKFQAGSHFVAHWKEIMRSWIHTWIRSPTIVFAYYIRVTIRTCLWEESCCLHLEWGRQESWTSWGCRRGSFRTFRMWLRWRRQETLTAWARGTGGGCWCHSTNETAGRQACQPKCSWKDNRIEWHVSTANLKCNTTTYQIGKYSYNKKTYSGV